MPRDQGRARSRSERGFSFRRTGESEKQAGRREAFARRMHALYGLDATTVAEKTGDLTHEEDRMRDIMEVVIARKLTNDPQQVLGTYLDAVGGLGDRPKDREDIRRLVTEFFANENLMARLILYRDEINKSKRRGDVPYTAFYRSIQQEERLCNMFNQPGAGFIGEFEEQVKVKEYWAREE